MAEKQGSSGALSRAIDILECLYANGGECSLTSIASQLGVYKSGVHRALQTLKERGMVCQDAVTGLYSLGSRLFVLGSMVGDNMAYVNLLRPSAEKLCDKYGECVHITLPYYDKNDLPRQLLAAKIQNPASVLTVSPPVGALTYCHASASGKCMLAFAPPGFLDSFRHLPLKAFTPSTITDWHVLDSQLEQIRASGYATEDSETELGLSCTGVPCIDRHGKLQVVISISGPTSRIRALDNDRVVADLKAAARAIV